MTSLNNGVESNITQTQPLWLLAEITYRCPLHCAFCYNPTDYADHTTNELNTDEWIKVLKDARKMGALQLGISGGEPLLRDDIEDIVTEANQLGYYSNLIPGAPCRSAPVRAAAGNGHAHLYRIPSHLPIQGASPSHELELQPIAKHTVQLGGVHLCLPGVKWRLEMEAPACG